MDIYLYYLQGKKGKNYPQFLLYSIVRDGNQLLYIIILLMCVLLRIRSGFAIALFVTCNSISIVLQNAILQNNYGILMSVVMFPLLNAMFYLN